MKISTKKTATVRQWQYSFAVVLVLIVLQCLSSLPSVSASGGEHFSLLMVGNSFSEAHNMEEMIQAMLNERKMLLQADSIFAARFEQGGANLTQYANSPGLSKMIHERPWTWIVLQEQSETPGFCDMKGSGRQIYDNSLQSVIKLNQQIEADSATTILFETWGYFDEDPYNTGYYTDFPTMQDHISHGYEIYRDSILDQNSNAKVKLAPAGMAFQRIYDAIKDKGDDPLADGSLFSQLYMTVEDHPTPDNNMARKYPTLAGSYLCGCVLFQTLTGLDVRQSGYIPSGLNIPLRKILQDVAYDTVVEYNKGLGISQETNQNQELSGSTYEYTLSHTAPPYVPQDGKGGGYTSSSPTWRWILAMVLLGGGLASYWVAGKQRQRQRAAYSTNYDNNLNSRDYGWNPISHDDITMELTDMPHSGGPSRPFP